MKLISATLALAATAVAVTGKQCENTNKCKRTCVLQGDPHLKDFEGHKDMLHADTNEWVNVYKEEGGEQILVKISKNGGNEYITGLKIGQAEYNSNLDCKQASGEHQGADGVTVTVKCATPKPGQFKKVADPKAKHFDIVVEKQYWANSKAGAESGACVGADHNVDCDCDQPTPNPTPMPTPEPTLSCEQRLNEQCGKEPKNCYLGSEDERCSSYITCADDNGYSECYTPKTRKPTPMPTTAKPTQEPTAQPTLQPTSKPTLKPTTQEPTPAPTNEPTRSCKELLKDECGPTPKNCFVGSVKEECSNFLQCVDDNELSECYKPKQYTCEQKLKRVCGQEPKNCYLGSEDERCSSYITCADDNGYSECYTPKTRKPTPMPTTAKPTQEPTAQPTLQPTSKPTLKPTTQEPTPAPTNEPTRSCKELLKDECGPTPKNCFVGSVKEECSNFLQCVDDNELSECYKPKQYTCEQKLKRVCGQEPKNCYAGSEDERCSSYVQCADDNGYSECYKPPVKPFKQLTCSATCSAEGDPHVETFFGDEYKTTVSGETITMINFNDWAVTAYVDPVGNKEYITKVTAGDKVWNAQDCHAGSENMGEFEMADSDTGNVVQGTVKCALPKKTNLKGKFGYHLNVELRQSFTINADVIENGTFQTFVDAMSSGAADTECMNAGDDATEDVTNWSGKKLAKKLHCQ